MKKHLLTTAACACALAALAAPAGAIDYGATEDEVKVSPATLLPQLAEVGLKKNVIRVTWNPDDPSALPPESGQIAALLPIASANGIRVVFAVYQARATALASSPVAVAQFSAWLGSLARRFPQVREYIGPNEPNQPRFWQPQFDEGCGNASGAAYFTAMSAMYDALKAADGGIRVVGVALSPRGNDNCRAASNVSTSPVRFLRALGQAYRGSGRRAPLMEALSFHPYPNENTHEPGRGYTWPNVGVPNLGRLKQAVWDAFGGTAQPTFEEGLTVDLDEVAWQVDTSARGDYTGAEDVPTVDEPTQARYYAEVVRFFACDPSVSSMSFFHFVDELDRDRFQSGLLRRDGSRREAFEAVRGAIAESGRGCAGRPVVWRHTSSVVGGEADFGTLARSSFKRTAYNFRVTADEEALYRAGIFRIAGRLDRGAVVRSLSTSGAPRPVGAAAGTVKANFDVLVQFPKRRLRPGRYVYAVRLRAAMNEARGVAFVSRPFVVR